MDERYSLVFFTTAGYEQVKKETVARLVGAGCVWPTAESNRYFANAIAPPKGSCKSIRECFGYEEKAGALQQTGTPLNKLGSAMYSVLSFIIAPSEMSLLCGLAKCLRDGAWSPASWQDTVVDTRKLKPAGIKAHSLWTSWTQARHILSGSWAIMSVSLLLSPRFAVWRWLERGGAPYTKASGKFVAVSQSPVPLSVTVRLDVLDGLLALGIANTNAPQAIVGSLLRRKTKSKMAFTGVFLQPRASTLFLNSDQFADVPYLETGTFLTLKILDGCMTILKDNAFVLTAQLPAPWRLDSHFYCAAVMDKPCTLCPCWSVM